MAYPLPAKRQLKMSIWIFGKLFYEQGCKTKKSNDYEYKRITNSRSACTSRAEKLRDATAGGHQYCAFPHGRRYRPVGPLVRESFWRSRSEQRRQRRRTGLHSDREYMAPRQRWGRPDTRQADGNAECSRSKPDQQLYEYPGGGHSSLL